MVMIDWFVDRLTAGFKVDSSAHVIVRDCQHTDMALVSGTTCKSQWSLHTSLSSCVPYFGQQCWNSTSDARNICSRFINAGKHFVHPTCQYFTVIL